VASFPAIAAIAFVAGVASAAPNILVELYNDVFPEDQAKRMALSECFQVDHAFNRLDGATREDCYRRILIDQTAAQRHPPSAPILAVNMVDLSRAAGRGSVPANDIRVQQETDNWVRKLRTSVQSPVAAPASRERAIKTAAHPPVGSPTPSRP
jgi:hypothetical protein